MTQKQAFTSALCIISLTKLVVYGTAGWLVIKRQNSFAKGGTP